MAFCVFRATLITNYAFTHTATLRDEFESLKALQDTFYTLHPLIDKTTKEPANVGAKTREENRCC